MRGKWILIAGSLVLAAAAAGVLMRWRTERAPAPQAKAAQEHQTLAAGATVDLSGIIEARHVVDVAVTVDGTIDQVLVENGQEVFEGQLLARISNSGLETARDIARNALEQMQTRIGTLESTILAARLEASRAAADASRARGEFDRTQRIQQRQQFLFREGATPRLVYEKAEKEFQTAKADFEGLDQVARQSEERIASLNRELDAAKKIFEDKRNTLEDAEARLSVAEIHAPVDGLVIARQGEPGDEVTMQKKDLFRIAIDLSTLEVAAEVPPAIEKRIAPGSKATVIIADMAGQNLEGDVLGMEKGKMRVEFVSPNPELRPGVSAQVRFRLN